MGHYNKAFELYYRQSPRDPTLLRIITDLSDLYLAVDAASRLQGGNVLCLTQVPFSPPHHRRTDGFDKLFSSLPFPES
jgi:hypothetical protein